MDDGDGLVKLGSVIMVGLGSVGGGDGYGWGMLARGSVDAFWWVVGAEDDGGNIVRRGIFVAFAAFKA